MEYILQDDILSIILLSFEENTIEKQNTIKEIYSHFDESLSTANRDVLIKANSFVDFIDGLYTEEDISIKSMLKVFKGEIKKELDFKPEIEYEAVKTVHMA